jgi:hypothetical protein
LSEVEVENSGEDYLIYTKISSDGSKESRIIIRKENTENLENIERYLGIVKAQIVIYPISLTVD